MIPNNSDFRAKEYRPQAKQAALKALELDPNLAEAHTSLAKVLFDFDFAGAEKSFKRAIELNPNYASAHQWYGELLSVSRRHDEAVKKATKAVELDPFSIAGNNNASIYLTRAGRFNEALLLLTKFNELIPNEERFHRFAFLIYAEQGNHVQPRNLSWTDKSVLFFGVPARREEAACSLPATTNQRSWGVKKECNLVRSDLHPQGELRKGKIIQQIHGFIEVNKRSTEVFRFRLSNTTCLLQRQMKISNLKMVRN